VPELRGTAAQPESHLVAGLIAEHRRGGRQECHRAGLVRISQPDGGLPCPSLSGCTADVKNRLSEVVDRLEREHGRVVITKHGHPAAVVISVEDLESLEETLDVMGSAALLDDIRGRWPNSAPLTHRC